MLVNPEGEADTTFVVRDRGRWLLAPVPASTPVPIDLTTLLAAVRAATPSPTLPAPDDVEPLPGDLRIGPVWTWVGRVTDGGLVVEGNDGRRLLLDPDDLRLLDAIEPSTTVAEAATATGIEDAPTRLARLAAAGRLRTGERAELPVPATETPVATRPTPSSTAADDGRIDVYAPWHEKVGPALSVGMLTAAARHWQDGALTATYDISRPTTHDQVLADLARRTGPAVLLCSNYVWSIEDNLALARQAKALRPDLVVIHGGPSTPKYPGDAEAFLADNAPVADVLVRGEGERTLCLVLEALAPTLPRIDVDRLREVGGLAFCDPDTGEVIRTGEPERIAEVDTLPSPYLTGEFDHVDPASWIRGLSIETNRGCPYGCTFCDWGSATLSRIRKFDLDRVLAEFQWAADQQVAVLQLCDANFGILPRDVEIAEGLADIRRRTRELEILAFTPAKNTTRHLTKILDTVIEAGILVSTAISLQTVDERTLAAVERSNIATDSYLALAADLRRRGLPLQGDVLIGLPEQTVDTFKADLQFFIEHEIAPRTWSLRVLPNAPMNDPDYRSRYAIETDENQIVTATATADRDDRRRMLALRKAQVIGDQFGLFAHLMRFLQWDHGIAMTDLLDHLIEVTTATPTRFPLLTWVLEYFDLHPTAPVGWAAFYDEVRQLLAEDLDLDPTRSDLDAVLRLQTHLLPSPERRFPATVDLAHDYVAYHLDATAELYRSGKASVPSRPLRDHGPATFTIDADPLGLCDTGLRFDGDSRDEAMLGEFWINIGNSFELLTPLTRVSPDFRDLDRAADRLDADDRVPVTLTPRASAAVRD